MPWELLVLPLVGREGLSGGLGTPQACICVRHQPDIRCVVLWCLGTVDWEEGRSQEQEKQVSEAASVSAAPQRISGGPLKTLGVAVFRLRPVNFTPATHKGISSTEAWACRPKRSRAYCPTVRAGTVAPEHSHQLSRDCHLGSLPRNQALGRHGSS